MSELLLCDMSVTKLSNIALCSVFYNRRLFHSSEICNVDSYTLLKSIAELDKLKKNAVSYKIQQSTILANKILANISKQIGKKGTGINSSNDKARTVFILKKEKNPY